MKNLRLRPIISFAVALLLTVWLLPVASCTAGIDTKTTSTPISADEVIPGVTVNQSFFSVIVLPDTQYYAETYPQIFLKQTRWVLENKERLNIIYVTHSGDIVNQSNDVSQWEYADIAMSVLDGAVPYGLLPGNHDQPDGNFNKYFGPERYEKYNWYGGHFGTTNDNNFEVIGDNLLFLNLGFSPSPEIIDWAKGVLEKYPERTAILNTHSAIDTKGILTAPGETLRALYQEPNLDLVLCGHIHGKGSAIIENGAHRTYLLLADYQKFESGGNGYLRILTFLPEKDVCVVNTFSPWTSTYISDADSHFEIGFPAPE
ncbi:MAG: metallophosphoesterase [Dehalococcoidales bacterium]|nr:metallophosphoesterase [Dehalococcoidales bacterium]